MAASYSKSQVIHSLSFSTNSPGGLTFHPNGTQSAFEVMQKYVTQVAQDVIADSTIQGFIGTDWVQVWGPVVWSKEQDNTTAHADNTMGAYYSPSSKLFVVAIAGTNPNSPYGWIDEDFAVNTTVEWKSITGTSGSGRISQGTATGLDVLLKMEDPNNGNIPLLYALTRYISKNSISGAELAVTGHSLGGALSPTLALYMSDKKSTWDPTGAVSLSTYPTAGPTPGNSKFADYYESQITSNKISYNSMYNPIDSVPMAWELDTIAKIPGLYESNIPSANNPVIGTVATGLALLSLLGSKDGHLLPVPYTQIKPWTALPGSQFNTEVDDKVTNTLKSIYKYFLPTNLQPYYADLLNIARFAAQAAAQHTIAYQSLLDVTGFITEYTKIIKNNKPANAISTSPITQAVMHATGINIETFNVADMDEMQKSLSLN